MDYFIYPFQYILSHCSLRMAQKNGQKVGSKLISMGFPKVVRTNYSINGDQIFVLRQTAILSVLCHILYFIRSTGKAS